MSDTIYQDAEGRCYTTPEANIRAWEARERAVTQAAVTREIRTVVIAAYKNLERAGSFYGHDITVAAYRQVLLLEEERQRTEREAQT
jgi:hypothetical protein